MRDGTLVTFALRQEGYPFARKLTKRTGKDGLVFGCLGTREIAVCWLGVGLKNIDLFARIVDKLRPEFVINSGFAGAVRSLLEPGDFVLATNYSSQEIVERLDASNLFSARGEFVIVNGIADSEAKARLSAKGHVLAIDMESERVAMICRKISSPFLTARMISDRSDEAIPKLFTGQKMREHKDIVHAIRFAGRMLVLRERLAAKVGRLIEEVASG
jgi:nucleoside phosphorylase